MTAAHALLTGLVRCSVKLCGIRPGFVEPLFALGGIYQELSLHLDHGLSNSCIF
jgi:hypothetical protein